MSEDDLDIWERALEQNLSVMATSSEAVDIIDGVVSKCPAIGPRYGGGVILGVVPVLTDMVFCVVFR